MSGVNVVLVVPVYPSQSVCKLLVTLWGVSFLAGPGTVRLLAAHGQIHLRREAGRLAEMWASVVAFPMSDVAHVVTVSFLCRRLKFDVKSFAWFRSTAWRPYFNHVFGMVHTLEAEHLMKVSVFLT